MPAMPRNPADLLSLAGTPAIRLLRACGVDEAVLRDGSDYDRFLALAAAMPCLSGNRLAATWMDVLQLSTGLTRPLCPHTAHLYWERWTEIHWYGREVSPTVPVPTHCPHCPPAEPTLIRAADTVALPDPMTLAADGALTDPDAYATHLRAAVSRAGAPVCLALPAAYAYVRPDPYHAALALRAVAEGRATDRDRDLLVAQTLRVIGEMPPNAAPTVLLRGGRPDAILPLFSYLADCNRLPRAVYIPADPADVAPVVGLYATVGTGYAVSASDTPTARRDKEAAYAAVAPIGKAVVCLCE